MLWAALVGESAGLGADGSSAGVLRAAAQSSTCSQYRWELARAAARPQARPGQDAPPCRRVAWHSQPSCPTRPDCRCGRVGRVCCTAGARGREGVGGECGYVVCLWNTGRDVKRGCWRGGACASVHCTCSTTSKTQHALSPCTAHHPAAVGNVTTRTRAKAGPWSLDLHSNASFHSQSPHHFPLPRSQTPPQAGSSPSSKIFNPYTGAPPSAL